MQRKLWHWQNRTTGCSRCLCKFPPAPHWVQRTQAQRETALPAGVGGVICILKHSLHQSWRYESQGCLYVQMNDVHGQDNERSLGSWKNRKYPKPPQSLLLLGKVQGESGRRMSWWHNIPFLPNTGHLFFPKEIILHLLVRFQRQLTKSYLLQMWPNYSNNNKS